MQGLKVHIYCRDEPSAAFVQFTGATLVIPREAQRVFGRKACLEYLTGAQYGSS